MLFLLLALPSCEFAHFEDAKGLKFVEVLPPPPVADPPPTLRAGLTPAPELFAQLQDEILFPRCQKCHDWVDDELDLLTLVDLKEPLNSDLWTYVEFDEMPPKGDPLTDEQKDLIQEYVLTVTKPAEIDSP